MTSVIMHDTDERPTSRANKLSWAVAVLVAGFATWMLVAGLSHDGRWKATVDVAEILSSALASAAALGAATRCSGARRRSWLWLGCGVGAWTLGEAYRALTEIVFRQQVPVPSPADVGFLLFPVLVAIGLVLHPAARATRALQRVRLLLDGMTALVSLVLVCWSLTILDASGSAPLRLAVLAHPLGDALLAILVLTTLSYAGRPDRQRLCWLLAGVIALTLADTAFAYLASDGSVASVSVADLLWLLGFAAIGLAAMRESGDTSARPLTEDLHMDATTGWAGLPYLLIACSAVAIASRWLIRGAAGNIETDLFVVLGMLVYLRQYTVLRENRQRLASLGARQQQVYQEALQDPLTGLADRTAFAELVDLALAGKNPPNNAVAYVVVKFRLVDAQLLGNLHRDDEDLVIFEVAARIKGCLGPDDELARVAESTFAVLRPGDERAGQQLAMEVLEALESPVAMRSGHRHIHLAAGIAAAPATATAAGLTGAELLQRAAVALNSVESPVGGIAFFDQRVLRAHAERVELREALLHAVRNGPHAAIQAKYEPVVNLADGTLAGVSARAGWRDRDAGAISAGSLAELSREAGLSVQVDDDLLAQAITAYSGWARELPTVPPDLWVTISADSLSTAGFSDRLSTVLNGAHIGPDVLIIDVIERPDDPATTAVVKHRLEQARAAGYRLVMNDAMTVGDDATRPGETFQISPQLVERCADDLHARRLIQATVEFANARGAVTAARQILTADQHEELDALGCRVGRGPLYGTGLTADAMGLLLADSAAGTYRAPIGQSTGRTRSSRAWQELRTVVSSLPVAAVACSADGTIVLAEGGLFRHLDVNPATLLGLSIIDVADARPDQQVPVQRALGGEPITANIRFGAHWVEAHMLPMCEADGTVTGLNIMAIDISDRIEAERSMRESEQRFRIVFDEAPVGVVIIGPDGHLQHVNAALAAMLGCTTEELAGRDVSSLWHHDNVLRSDKQYAAAHSGSGPTYRGERAYRHKDGSAVWARVAVGSLGKDAPPGTVIAIVEDLSQIKALEVKLRHAQKLESIGMLAAGIAHEINTPTQFVGDNLAFLQESFTTLWDLLTTTERLTRPVDEGAAAELDASREAADLTWLSEQIPAAVTQSIEGIGRVTNLVQAMRNFGHPDGRDPAPIDINAAIHDTTTVARNEYKYVADLVLELGDVPPVMGYPSEFNQVILNLVVNAAQAIAEANDGSTRRGTIIIRSWSDAASVHVAVTDDGSGIAPQTLEHVFDPFFTTKPVGKGTGQGLAIAHSVIVDKHGGTIDVESELAVGTTFTVHLPIPATASPENIASAQPEASTLIG